MQLPHALRRVNHAFGNKVMGVFAGRVPPLVVVHHVGRRSGARYRSPVLATRTATGYVVPLAYGDDTDWCRNVLAAGGCTLTLPRGNVRLSHPEIVSYTDIVTGLHPAWRALLRTTRFPAYLRLTAEGQQVAPPG